MVTRATVISDASFCHRTHAGGWAVWINVNHDDGRHVRIKETGTFHSLPATSTEAEAWAAYNGVWMAYHNGARDILVQTDCDAVVRRRSHADLRQFCPDASINWKHVKGHNLGKINDRRTWVNDWCDRQAKRHMKKQRREIERGLKS